MTEEGARIQPSRSLPWIRLVRDENETLEDAFKKSGRPGRVEDYLVICRVIINPLPSNAPLLADTKHKGT
jgi:hypothetical protein